MFVMLCPEISANVRCSEWRLGAPRGGVELVATPVGNFSTLSIR